MSPLFMDAGYELTSPGSASAEESNAAGSEREGGGKQMRNRGRIRKEKNRDSARKSRRKQMERADELHEELQGLERSNSALNKEIAALKKDLQLYTTALERHKPACCLKQSLASTSPSAACRTSSSPPGLPPQASSSSSAAASSPSTSFISSLGRLPSRDCVESTLVSSLTPPSPALASSSSSSTDLFTSSRSAASVSFSASSFSEDPPSLITSRPTNDPPLCTSLLSPHGASSSHPIAAQSGQRRMHDSSSVSPPAGFPPLRPRALDEFLMTQASFLPASSPVVPPHGHLVAEKEGLVARGCPMNVSQPYSGQSSRKSCPPGSLVPPPPAPHALAAPSPAFDLTLKPNYSPQVTHNHVPLLSLLTTPSPLNVSTSSSFDGAEPPPSLPLLGDPSTDLSLSKFLEVNDWIISGTSHQ